MILDYYCSFLQLYIILKYFDLYKRGASRINGIYKYKQSMPQYFYLVQKVLRKPPNPASESPFFPRKLSRGKTRGDSARSRVSLVIMERQDCLMSICFIICSAVFITCSTPLIIWAIYDVICGAFVVICSTFVVKCCGFATICGAYVIICSDFSIIPTFCRYISSVLSLYRVVYALYGVQTI